MNLNEIRMAFNDLAIVIDMPAYLIPGFGEQTGEAVPYVEVDNGHFPIYRYIVKERGVELQNRQTMDVDELLYWLFSSITFEIAQKEMLKVWEGNVDQRRISFAIQERMLGTLKEQWQEKCGAEHTYILNIAPFDDFSAIRAGYIRQLMKEGVLYEDAYKLAFNKYPLPK